MRVIGVDPGTTQSALVMLGENRVLQHYLVPNAEFLERLRACATHVRDHTPDDVLVIEQIAAMGMAVGASTFETVFWSGRFAQAWRDYAEKPFYRVKRHEVKQYLCGNQRAKDPNIRQALIDRFGGDSAIGRKGSQGPLYGLKGDCWSALAVAVTWQATHAPTTLLAASEATL